MEKRIQKKLTRSELAKERKIRKARRRERQEEAAALLGQAAQQTPKKLAEPAAAAAASAADASSYLALEPQPADASLIDSQAASTPFTSIRQQSPAAAPKDSSSTIVARDSEQAATEVSSSGQAGTTSRKDKKAAKRRARGGHKADAGGKDGKSQSPPPADHAALPSAAKKSTPSSPADTVSKANSPQAKKPKQLQSSDLAVEGEAISDGEQEVADGESAALAKRKGNPMVSQEVLQLSLVEAFFLRQAVDVLRIVDQQDRILPLHKIWQQFCRSSSTFVQDYVTYLSLRSRGWVPKSGLKFAVDFVAYRQGPPFFHSSYSVLVRTAWADTLQPWDPRDEARPLNWPYLFNINRMANQASKELVLCYVLRPRDLSDEDLADPSCIRRFQVQHVLARRWLPSKSR